MSSHESVHYEKKLLPVKWVRRVLLRQQRRIYARYARAFPPRRGERILDLGVNASLQNRSQYFFEDAYPYPSQVTAAGLEPGDTIERVLPDVTYVQVDRGPRLPFDDGAFDVVFCSAVIEHVGNRAAQAGFLAEVLRVGRAAFVTTPNRWYPIELHTLLPLVHYLPPDQARAVMRRLGFAFFADEENLNLLDRTDFRGLTPRGVDVRIEDARFFGPVSNLLGIFRRTT